MNTMRGITLTALALLLGACKDAPTFPGLEIDSNPAAAEAAMEVASAQTVIEDRLATASGNEATRTRRREGDTLPPARRPGDPVRPERPDTARTRPDDPRRPEERRPDNSRAELAVALGAKAIDLAGRLLADHGADEEQKRLYQNAQELQRKAEAALAEGRIDSAVQLAEAASQMALKSVVRPGGITEAEARMIHEVAGDLLEKAKSAVAADPSDFKRHLLKVAEELYREGTEKLKDGRDESRGVVPLWKSAIISSFLVG